MVTFLLLCALILVAGKEDEKEMEFDRWVLELVVEHAKRDLLCSGEASPGSCKRDESHIFFSLFESSNYGTGSSYNPMGLTSIRWVIKSCD